LSESGLGLTVKYCTTGGEEQIKENIRLEPNEEGDLQALYLSEGEEDNELHIYDTYGRELLTLRFKVNTADVGSSEPSTMTLPDEGVIQLMIKGGLENQIELLASSGIHTIEQIRNMTDEDRKEYRLSLAFRGVVEAALSGRAKRQKIGGNQAGLQSMLSILETL
jgi:hypothetical protein